MALLVFVFISVASVCATILLWATRATRQDKVIASRLSDLRNPRRALKEESQDSDEEQVDPRLSTQVGAYLLRFRFSMKLQTLLLQAQSTWTLGVFGLVSIGAASSCFIGAWSLLHSFSGACLCGAVGLLLPYMWLKRMRSSRLRKFGEALPNALDLMARALRAGHSIQQSLEMISEQAPAPLSQEFAEVHQHQKFGIPFRDALVRMGERVASKDLHFVITAILVQKETGGDLIEILDRTTAVIRDRVRVEGEIKTYTAQGRLTGWILSLMPVGLLAVISIASPAYTHILFVDQLGQHLLMAAAVMIVIGGLVIRKIVAVEM